MNGTRIANEMALAISFHLCIQAQLETQKAAQEYQRSVELYRVAKETLSLAESKLLKSDKREFDAAWQEYVNHATMKVGGVQ